MNLKTGDKVFSDTLGHYFIWDIRRDSYVLYPQTSDRVDRSSTFDILKALTVPRKNMCEPYWKLESKIVEDFEKPSKKQVGGTHYTDLAIQPLDVIKANKMGFLDGTALKYIMRFRGKNGIEDLRKAIHYCELLIAELEEENAER